MSERSLLIDMASVGEEEVEMKMRPEESNDEEEGEGR